MKKAILIISFWAINSIICSAQSATWSEDIACIVYTHCVQCHNNTNSIAAISFTNYKEAWAQRNAIKYYVENKLMPPYQASTEKQQYSHEKILTQTEIDLIVNWVNNGAKQGDSTLAPKVPSIKPLISQLSAPDISYRIPPYTVPNTVGFQYHCFVLPTTFSIEKRISEIEILPTKLSAIYSVFLYSDTSSIPLTLDAIDTSNGYENYAGIGSPTAKLLYGWTNGNPYYHTPPNTAIRLEANAHLVLRILFAEDALNKIDSTLLNIKFDDSATRLIDVATFLDHNTNLQNPPFIIPADSIKTFYEKYTVPNDISLIGVSHWGQKFCSNMNCFAVTPSSDTISILKIENQSDLWSQGVYYFYKPIKIPSGSILYGIAEYDNTSSNDNNPFFPPHTIVAGNKDTSEQMLFSFSYTPYQSGDENIISDSTIHQLHYLNCNSIHTVSGISNTLSKNTLSIYPNPANDELNITSTDNKIFSVNIFNSFGENIYSATKSANYKLQIVKWTSGLYFIQIKSQNTFQTFKIIKQ